MTYLIKQSGNKFLKFPLYRWEAYEMQLVLKSESDQFCSNGPCITTDIGKENIGILDEISLQLDFLFESEPMLWCGYQHGSSITVQTSGTMDIRASHLEHKCMVPEFPSRVNDRQNICQGGPSTPLHYSD